MSVSMKYAPHQRPSGRKGPLDIISNLFRRSKDVGAVDDDDDERIDRIHDDVSASIMCAAPPSAYVTPHRMCPGHHSSAQNCQTVGVSTCQQSRDNHNLVINDTEDVSSSDPLSGVDLVLRASSLTDDTSYTSLAATSLCSSPETRSTCSRGGASTGGGVCGGSGIDVRLAAVARHRAHNFDRDVEETLRLSRHDNPVVQKKLASCLGASDESGILVLGTSLASLGSPNECRKPSSQSSAQSAAAAAALLMHPSPRDSYSPFDDIQQHLVRSPPPCIATLRSFTYDSDGGSCDLCFSPGGTGADDDEEEDDEDDVFRAGLRQVRNAPLPHVKQSCPMFRPLSTVQKCIFQESRMYRDNKKQPKDLKPLLSRSSNDVIDLRTRMFEVHQRQREMIAGNQTNLCSSVPTSPLLLAVTRRQRHLSTPARPMTYPTQKTL